MAQQRIVSSYSKKHALLRHAAATLLFRIQRRGGGICEALLFIFKEIHAVFDFCYFFPFLSLIPSSGIILMK